MMKKSRIGLACSAAVVLAAAGAQSGCGPGDSCEVTLTCPTGSGGAGAGSNVGGSGTGMDGGGGGGAGEGKADGVGCGDGNECQSGLCVDGVCCATACDGTCEACDLAGSEGTCTPHAPGTDPESECGEGSCSGETVCAVGTEVFNVPVESQTFRRVTVDFDNAGNLFVGALVIADLSVAGQALPLPGNFASFLYTGRVDSSGALMWSTGALIGELDYNGDGAMAVDPTGGVVLTGSANTPTSFGGPQIASSGSEVFVVRLDADGQHDWTRTFSSSSILGERVPLVTVDDGGAIYIVGSSNGNATLCGTAVPPDSIFVLKLANDGSCLWTQHWAEAQTTQLAGLSAAMDGVFVAGSFDGTLDFGGNPLTSNGTDMFVARLDPQNGGAVWSKRFGEQGDQRARGVAVMADGDVLLAGQGAGNIDFGGSLLTGGNDDDVLVARLTGTGAHVTSSRHGDSAPQAVRAIAVGPGDYWALVGQSQGLMSFGEASLQTSGAMSFVGAFHGDGAGLWLRSPSLAPALGHAMDVAVGPNGDLVALVDGGGAPSDQVLRLVRYAP